jgi:hypothetical protein
MFVVMRFSGAASVASRRGDIHAPGGSALLRSIPLNPLTNTGLARHLPLLARALPRKVRLESVKGSSTVKLRSTISCDTPQTS